MNDKARGVVSRREFVTATAVATAVGNSVAVDGCCLTATALESERISFHAVPETVARTTLGSLVADARVNVEPALRVGDAARDPGPGRRGRRARAAPRRGPLPRARARRRHAGGEVTP